MAHARQRAKHTLGVFIVNRHQERRAPHRPAMRRIRSKRAVKQHPQKAENGARAGKGDPGEGDGKEGGKHNLQP